MVLPSSGESPVVSEVARRWVHGEMDSRSYFEQARRLAMGRARAEVTLRLYGNSRDRRAGGRSPGWLQALPVARLR